VLGPKGLMPNPKSGTVTFDVTKAIEEIKPAHLAFDHTFTYDYWDNVNGTMTWGSATTWEALRTY
jgi:hypothetical protein